MSSVWPLSGSFAFEGDVPVFTFVAGTRTAVVQLFDAMFVEVDVRYDAAGALAYHLSLPDRGLVPCAVPLPADQLPRLERGAARMNVCPTFVAFTEGERLDLSRFVTDVTHDWSAAYARAWGPFLQGRFTQAGVALMPFAAAPGVPVAPARLLGRTLRELGRLEEAIAQYRGTLALACRSGTDELLPLAAGVLNDLGVAYKRSGDSVRAEISLLHALHLRPNYPQALLTLAATTLDPSLVLHAAARVLAIGGHDALVEALLASVAEATATSAADWRPRVELCISDVDLHVWPLARRGLGTLSAIQRDLDRGQMTFGPTPAEALANLPARPPRAKG
jgi:tetratricopeptide (TPR) repeat protein